VSDREPFSKRYGLKPMKVMQDKAMNADLRNSLYNCIFVHYLQPNKSQKRPGLCAPTLNLLVTSLWANYLKKPVDEAPVYWSDVCEKIKNYITKEPYQEVYDLIEFIANNFDNDTSGSLVIDDRNDKFRESCNRVLRIEMTPYQFVGGLITNLTSDQEIEQIENALRSPLETVKTHISTAHQFLADKKNPNYRNSIKESISAVESICLITTGEKHSFSRALDQLTKNGIEIPSSLKVAFDKLYGWSSSEDGIRHALLEEPKLDHEDAMFALVACSAFVNYLTIKADKAGIKFGNDYKKLAQD
jgi:hypothetical protein